MAIVARSVPFSKSGKKDSVLRGIPRDRKCPEFQRSAGGIGEGCYKRSTLREPLSYLS